MTAAELAQYIDHSVLKPQFTLDDIREQIKRGIVYGCKTVCVNPAYASLAKELCAGTKTGVCAVCDFPFGASSTESKVAQAELILKGGGIEDLDVVANYGLMRSGAWDEAKRDIKAVTDAAHAHGANIKVIFEADALSMDEIVRATEIACEAGVDFVKTSTGFYTGGELHGATPEIIKAMIDTAAGRCRVKGSGCIRSREHFLALIDLGIDRMGIGYTSTPIVLNIQ